MSYTNEMKNALEASPALKAMVEKLAFALEQEKEISKAACKLADRYRDERDGARAATAATKSKVADAALFGTDVQDAIRKALGGEGVTLGVIDRDSPEAAKRLAKVRDRMFERPAAKTRTASNVRHNGID